MWQWVKEATVKVFWPWFRAAAWPVIKKHLAELISFAFDLLKERFKDWASERAKNRSDEAAKKAQESEAQAKATTNPEDAEKHRTVAQVWREVAEQFRQENEALKNRIEELSADATEQSLKDIEALDIELEFSDGPPTLLVGATSHELPALAVSEKPTD